MYGISKPVYVAEGRAKVIVYSRIFQPRSEDRGNCVIRIRIDYSNQWPATGWKNLGRDAGVAGRIRDGLI